MSSEDNKSSSPLTGHRVFATTSWSMVLDAGNVEDNSSRAVAALSDLCQQYWYPLYAFVRRKGFEQSRAEDLTQAFFTDLLEKKRLQHAEPSRGSFRAFLLTSLDNFMANQWRAENAQKRGGGQTVLSLDFENADHRYREQAGQDESPEKIFERNWAFSILEQTRLAVQAQYEETGKLELFKSLEGFLTGQKVPYKQLSEETGIREGALKVAVYRLRQRYGQQLRLQIARTLGDSSQVDTELQSLFRALE